MVQTNMFMDEDQCDLVIQCYSFLFYMFAIQFIGSKETDQKAQEVRKLGVTSLWTPDNHYRWSKSRYGNHVSVLVDQVRQPRFLLNSMSF
jgi:hypothetical protein